MHSLYNFHIMADEYGHQRNMLLQEGHLQPSKHDIHLINLILELNNKRQIFIVFTVFIP